MGPKSRSRHGTAEDDPSGRLLVSHRLQENEAASDCSNENEVAETSNWMSAGTSLLHYLPLSAG